VRFGSVIAKLVSNFHPKRRKIAQYLFVQLLVENARVLPEQL
jgi:hypothetical protein